MFKKIFLIVGMGGFLSSQNYFQSTPSLQGFTGLLNIPNAQVMDEGAISFSYDNEFDTFLRKYNKNNPKCKANDYIFSVGFLPNLEIQGRFKDQGFKKIPGGIRDLSANIKWKVPHLYYNWLPNIAIGAQDVGSAANIYGNYYIVMDKRIGKVKGTLGYGHSHNDRNIPRMDGVFGGIEIMPFPWIDFIGEYDGKEKHAGIRLHSRYLNTPDFFTGKIRVDATVGHNFNEAMNYFQIAFIFKPGAKDENSSVSIKNSSIYTVLSKENDKKLVKKLSKNNFILNSVKKLRESGLRNISVRIDDKNRVLIVYFENTIYRYNELDAMQEVLKDTIELSPWYDKLILVPEKSDIALAYFSLSLKRAKDYILNPSPQNYLFFQKSIKKSLTMPKYDALYIANELNSDRFRTHLRLIPLLTSFVATEFGNFDYQLLMGWDFYWNLYKGLDLDVEYDTKISKTDDFNIYNGRYSRYYNDGGLNSILLRYSLNYKGIYNTISVGLYKYQYYGFSDEISYYYGVHTFSFKGGYMERYNDYELYKHPTNSQKYKEFYIGSYTYNYIPWDLQLKVEAGQFWYWDRGFKLSAKKYFGDVAVSLNYIDSKPESSNGFWQSEHNNYYVGMSIEIPLDFRKSKSSWKYLQIEGKKDWTYSINSTFHRKDGTNKIVPGATINPSMNFSIDSDMANRGRWSRKYIKQNANYLLKF